MSGLGGDTVKGMEDELMEIWTLLSEYRRKMLLQSARDIALSAEYERKRNDHYGQTTLKYPMRGE